jgi:hypothetical protein
VSVTLRAALNGYSSINTPSFDNCAYWHAMLAAGPGAAALTHALEFPEDSDPPTTTATTYGEGQVNGNTATESWVVELLCSDPEVGGFASGCSRTEYRLDAGDVTPYGEPVIVRDGGSHVVEYRSVDAAGKEEVFRSIALSISCPLGAPDGDGDGIADDCDNCPAISNVDQANRETDSVGDVCDNCPYYASADQTDTDGDGRGDACECTDQSGEGRNTVTDLVEINKAIFNPTLAKPLCDGNNDGDCNVNDIIAANVEIFSPGNTSICARQPVSGP